MITGKLFFTFVLFEDGWMEPAGVLPGGVGRGDLVCTILRGLPTCFLRKWKMPLKAVFMVAKPCFLFEKRKGRCCHTHGFPFLSHKPTVISAEEEADLLRLLSVTLFSALETAVLLWESLIIWLAFFSPIIAKALVF